MYLDRYTYHVEDNFLTFKFISEGPKGKVIKAVKYSRLRMGFYNLAFGDFDESIGRLNDTSVTNNGDSIKVLATVAATVHDFAQRHPNAAIFIKGSTHSRTRLYRRGITIHWDNVVVEFEVFGSVDEVWEPFISGKDYDAFLIKRK